MSNTPNLAIELENFMARPDVYMGDGKSGADSSVIATNVMLLMEYTKFNPDVMNHIFNSCLLKPEHIIAANGTNKLKILLIETAYLNKHQSFISIMCHYFEHQYTRKCNDFTTADFFNLLSNTVSKLDSSDEKQDIDYLVDSLMRVTINCANDINSIKSEEHLKRFMHMYWFIDHATQKNEKMLDAMNIFANKLYGSKFIKIVDTARILDCTHDSSYWASCIKYNYSEDSIELPTI